MQHMDRQLSQQMRKVIRKKLLLSFLLIVYIRRARLSIGECAKIGGKMAKKSVKERRAHSSATKNSAGANVAAGDRLMVHHHDAASGVALPDEGGQLQRLAPGRLAEVSVDMARNIMRISF